MTSMILPQYSSAQTSTPELSVEDEIKLEKKKENEVEKQLETGKSSNDSSTATISSLVDGLEFEEVQAAEEQEEFVMDGKVDTKIVNLLDESETANVIIRLKDKVDMDNLFSSLSDVNRKDDRTESVVNSLQRVADESQGNLVTQLESLEKDNKVSNIKQFWVFNGVTATISKGALDEIAQRDDVEKITLDVEIQAPEFKVENTKPRLPEWGLEKIFATKVWGEYDLQGEGVVVGIMDTGVQGDHEALRQNYRGRDGNHQYSWIDLSGHDYSEPTDGNGHGTHVAGTAVGGGEGEPVGVAPGAEWIAAKIFNDGGGTTASAIHEAFEWFLAPGGDPSMAPDVVNNSWGSADTYRTEFLEGVQAWVAAGIFPLFAAGNDGPGAGTIGSPASFPESFAIGATDRYDQIASFSSRGPVYWTNEDGEEEYHVKPEVSAPGHEIYSSLPDGGYGTLSGTSMATPHVAGAIALILDSNPDLSIDDVMNLLEGTARTEAHMGELPNDNFGHGIVNVYQAVTEAAYAGDVTGTLTDEEGNPIEGMVSVPKEDIHVAIGEDGVFDFKLREGLHEVEVTSFGYHTKTVTVEIVKGETKENNWSLEIAERYDVTGTVSFENDNPAAFAYVRVKDTPLNTFRTNADGEFTIPSIPEDEYTIVISGKGLKQVTETVVVNRNVQLNVKVEGITIEAEEDWTTSKNNNARNAVTDAEVDAENLIENWSYQTPGQVIFSSPVIAEGKVVFTTDRGNIVVLDQHTGEEIWTIGTGNTNRSTPTVVDGVVYVAGGGDYSIHAIELETGMKKWTAEVDYPAVYEAPIYHDGVLYISSYMDENAKTIALDAETGNQIWEQEIGDGAFFGAVLGSDSLYVGTYDSKTLSSLALEDGSINWQVTLESEGFPANPVFKDGVIYASTSNFDNESGTLRAFDSETGEELWSASGIGNSEAGSPIVFDDLVIVTSAVHPIIKAFNKEDGDLVWEVENGSTIVNTGAVSGNGQLFVTDLASKLNVYDVYAGEKLYTYNLRDVSTAGVALTDGQVVTADYSEVTSFNSPGTVVGNIVDTNGNPVQARVEIMETGEFVEADTDGNYSLQTRPGNYTLKVMAYGYKQIVEEVNVISGYEIAKDYELEIADAGSLTGQIVDEGTGDPLEGVTVTVENTPLDTPTGANGSFYFDEVFEGTYEVTLALPGYVADTITVTIEAGEETELTQSLSKVEVAVLHDMDGQIVRFLNNNQISAEEHDWEIIDNIGNFEVVYLNGAYTSDGPKPTEEQILDIIAAAKEHDVSLVFADTWGPSYGSIKYLSDYTGDPAQEGSDTSSINNVILQVDEEHPILDGIDSGVTYTTLTNGYAAWFNQYSGRNLASVGPSDEGIQGTGVAYKGVTEESAHLLLSTHAASPWVSPFDGWTSVQQQIFLNGIDYLLEDAQFGTVSGVVTDDEGNPLEGVTVQAVDTGVTATTSEDGTYELLHDEGSYAVSFTKSGFASYEDTVEFTKGQPVEQNVEMSVSNSGTISGQITNRVTGQQVPYVEIDLYDQEGNLVAEEVSTTSGAYEITGLDEATYTMEIVLRDYVTYSETLQVGAEPISLNIELYPEPRVATVGDYSFGSVRDVLSEVGIEAEEYDLAGAMEELPNLDVVFFNEQSTLSVTKEQLEEFIALADEHEVSVIYGDTYWSGSGINHLVENFNDPETRTTHRDTSSSAGYLVEETNPIFGDAEADEFVEILTPSASSVGSFEGYTGYTLADITHGGNEDTHGTGVAYKPRTAGSMELLMSGHGTSFTHGTDDYTAKGNEILLNAILWAAFIEYNVVEGYVTDEEGNPLDAEVKVIGEIEQEATTDPETGYFNIGSLDGDYELEVNSFGYQTHTEIVTVDENLEALTIEMVVDQNVGSIAGTFIDEDTLEGIEDAHINVVDQPREAITNVSGDFVVERLMPGTYTIVVEKDGYVLQEFDVDVKAGEETTIERTMKPSPTVGVIVDTDGSRYLSVTDYLTERGYIVEDLFFTDLERVSDMDLIFVNSDYDNNLIPEEDVFVAFTQELDRTETPVIWTGSSGPRGGIRFLVDYFGDPEIEYAGSNPSSNRTMTATLAEDHPILEGVEFDDNGEFTFENGYYYGFDGYTGTTLATVANENQGDLGSFVAVGGRTLNSVEVLLSTMTFGYGFTNDYFDKDRERIINNAITFALDNKEPLVGEVHGTVTNNLENEVFATVTVEETGYTIDTEQDGSFFLGLEDGSYTLTFDAFGHETESFDITVIQGEVLEQTFTLTADNSGSIVGQVKAEDTGDVLEDAKVQLVGTPLQATTDEDGNYEINAPAGEYQVRVTANGYTPQVVTADVVHNEQLTLNFDLSISEKIAFVSTSLNEDRAIPFLEEQGYEADFWLNSEIDQLMDQMDEYALIIYNDRHTSSTPEEKFKEFIDMADEYGISMIFPGQWNNGTIRYLSDFYGDPETDTSDFVDNYIDFTVLEEHPIFEGFEIGEQIKVAERDGSTQQYYSFENYSGTTIADVTHYDEGRLGSGVAYDFRTSSSVHVLLGSLHIGSYGYPDDRWTEDAKQIYINAIDWAISASLGEVNGTVKDVDGEPIAGATVSIDEQGLSTKTNSNGEYTLGVGIGEHEVEVQAKGYTPASEVIEIEDLGHVVELNFELEKTDRMSLSGQISDIDGNGLEEVQITLTEMDGNEERVQTTNVDGYYQFDVLLAGEYELLVEANGYQSITETLTISEGEDVERNYTLSEFNIAVVGDVKGSLESFFEENDFPAQNRDWNIVNDVYNYRVIIVNSNDGTVEQLNELIEKADEYETSLIFVDTWGVDGSIKLLEEVFGSPTLANQGYDEGAVFVEPQGQHELFSGFDENTINIHSEQSPYATFENYEGITLANLVVDDEDKGATIAYDFRGQNHMHLLLSSFAVNNMIGPNQGWTEEGQQLFLQAVEWARDGSQDLPNIPEWTVEGDLITNGDVELTGTAEYRSTVNIIHDGEVLATATPDRNNNFTVQVTDLEAGIYDFTLEANNYAGTTSSQEVIQVVVDREAPVLEVLEPTDQFVTGNEVVDVVGSVTDEHLNKVMVNEEEVEVQDGNFSTRIILEAGTNIVEITAIDLAENETVVERQVTVSLDAPVIDELQPAADQSVKPGDQVTISFMSEAEGGEASFSIKVPGLSSTQSTTNNEMEEVEPGFYQGTWNVPTDMDLQGAVIEVELTDQAGNTTRQEAPGKLYISSDQLDRIFGEKRYDTAIEISKEGWESSDVVVLAQGNDFADALAGVPLAHQLDAPILLTKSADLNEETFREIERLEAREVIVLGGTTAIHESVVTELEEAGLDVRRIAGEKRYETAALIAEEVAPDGAEQVVITNGRNFPDALSIGSHAAEVGMPILLTKTDELPTATEEALANLGVAETLVVGGPDVISEELLTDLPQAERLAGENRYETNVAVHEHFGVGSRHLYVSTGRNYADALTGAVLAAKNDSAIILVGNKVPDGVSELIEGNDIQRLTIFGGEEAVSMDVASELEALLP
ncbi:carboxypeptidase regulatory-like domain-containing protein [Ornithinibacillus salinisoli]